jgi:hypothetical protein
MSESKSLGKDAGNCWRHWIGIRHPANEAVREAVCDMFVLSPRFKDLA